MRPRLTALLLALATATAARAQTPTVDESLSIKWPQGARVSPDGKLVAYATSEPDWEANAYKSDIWVADVATRSSYRLTNAKKSSRDPHWSPDGKRLAFISERDGKPQVYLISPRGGEAARLTDHETGVSEFHWSPDGRAIAFAAADPESKQLKERKEKYGDFEVFESDHTMTHLWRVEVPAGELAKPVKGERLTEGTAFTVVDFSWAPDSKRIAFAAAETPAIADRHTCDIYVLGVEDKKVRKVVSTAGPDTNPHWSPDGQRIAFETAAGQEFFYHANSRIAVVPADGGEPRVLTADLDEDPRLLGWGPDGIYCVAQQRTQSFLYRLEPGETPVRVAGPNSVAFAGATFTADYRQAAWVAARPGAFPEVCLVALRGEGSRAVTSLGEQVARFRLATREVITWKSKDGTPIEGVLVKPPDFDPAKKHPLLVVIHGGPTGIDTPALRREYAYPIERFAAKGALVLQPNYRGSAGYGEKFRQLNVRNLGVGDAEDVISGVDFLVGKGWADPAKVGAMGWSQGGYISAFLTCASDRFKAVSVGAGISDWMTYYANTDIPPFTRQYLKATPWDDPEVYRKTSPIAYLKTAKTPTLIQHGDGDRRVPIANAYELYRGLRDRGVPARLLVYKGFGHGITKPKEQRALLDQNYEWFCEHLWGEKPAK